MTFSKKSVVFTAVLFLAAALAQKHADAQTITFLALKGDGNATVTIDGPVAYIADGGRKGQRGIGGATVDGQSIPDYLRKSHVTTVVISCSHPHDDHMAGLSDLIKGSGLDGFDVHLIDSLPIQSDGQYDKRSLATEAKDAQKSFNYHSALDKDAFASLPRGSHLLVRNFVYDPKDVGESEHDAATILEYEFPRPGKTRRIVDFDDASKELLSKWKIETHDAKAAEYVLVAAHHGSKYNSLDDILGSSELFAVTDIIISANVNNQYGHPDPGELLKAINRVGPDHLFITQSDSGTNIEIDSTGEIAPAVRGNARARLAAYLANRRRFMESKVASLLEQAQKGASRGPVEALDAGRTATSRERLVHYVRQSPSLTKYEKDQFGRLVGQLEQISQAQAVVGGGDHDAIDAFFALHLNGLLARSTRGGDDRRREAVPAFTGSQSDHDGTTGGSQPPKGGPDNSGLSTMRPPPDNPSGPDSSGAAATASSYTPPDAQSPTSGSAPNDLPPSGGPPRPDGRAFNNSATTAFFDQATETRQDLDRRFPGVRSSGSLAQVRMATYTASVRTTSVRFGGVIVGNRVTGPAGAAQLEFVPITDDDSPNSIASSKTYVLRVHFKDNTTADYSGFTVQDLWAAVNFVQPTSFLLKSLRAAGRSDPFLGTDVGVVGIRRRKLLSHYFPSHGGWYFAVNPAVAHTRLAFDTMRLDMLIATLRLLGSQTTANLVPVFREFDLKATKFDTYQWHDVPTQIDLQDGVGFPRFGGQS